VIGGLFGSALIISGCAERVRPSAPREALSAAPSPSPSISPDFGDSPPIDWTVPPISGVELASIEEASSYLPFQPLVPSGLSSVPTVIVTPDPVPMEERILALMYSDAEYGTLYLTEAISQTNYEELRELAASCAEDPVCNGADSIVKLQSGLDGLLIAGSKATSIVVLLGEVRIDIVGPADSLSPDEVIALANTL